MRSDSQYLLHKPNETSLSSIQYPPLPPLAISNLATEHPIKLIFAGEISLGDAFIFYQNLRPALPTNFFATYS